MSLVRVPAPDASSCRGQSPPPTRNRRTRLAKWLLAFVIAPAILLVLLELGLRVGGYGHSTRFFVRRDFGGETFYVSNKASYQQFFSLPLDSIVNWDDLECAVPSPKPGNAYRIFAFGGSAANGMPPDSAYAFWRVLDVMLRTRFPQTRFEVYNVSCPGANSHVMYLAAKACARLEPDLFVVYMGNNEAIGPFGVATKFAKGYSRSLLASRANTWLGGLRSAQLMSGRTGELHRPPVVEPDDIWQYYSRIDPSDPRLEIVFAHFESNLRGICKAGAEAGAAVVLCTVGRNRSGYGPYVSRHRAGLSGGERERWEAHYRDGIALEEAAAHGRALDAYVAAAAIDETYAELQFRMGRCHHALGSYDLALRCFSMAREFDFVPSGACARTLAAIEKVANEMSHRGVHLADAVRYLAQRSPGGIAGLDCFWDTVHPSYDGNYEIARSVFDRLVPALPERIRAGTGPAAAAPSQAECERRLALTPWVRKAHLAAALNGMPAFLDEVMAGWRESRARLRKCMADLEQEAGANGRQAAIEAYRSATELAERDYFLRDRHLKALMDTDDTDDTDAAFESARAFVSMFPERRASHRILGQLWARAGNSDNAIAEFEKVLFTYPDDAPSHMELGQIAQEAGRLEESLAAYRNVLAIDPDNEYARCTEGEVLERLGRHRAAMDAYRAALAIRPEYELAFGHLDRLLAERASPAERIAQWRQSVRQHPNFARVHYYLAVALEAADDIEGAANAYREAAERDEAYAPDADCARARALTRSGQRLIEEGNPDRAINAFRQAIVLAPQDAEPRMCLASYLAAKGDVEGAMCTYGEAIAAAPGCHLPYYPLDSLFIRRNDPSARVEEWRRVASAHPDAARAHFHLGMALESNAKLDEATEAYRRACDLDPGDPAMRAHLGLALLETGGLHEAIPALRAALALNPDMPHVSEALAQAVREAAGQ